MSEAEQILEAAQIRISALDRLLTCYRLGKRPSHRVMADLGVSRIVWNDVVKQHANLAAPNSGTNVPTEGT